MMRIAFRAPAAVLLAALSLAACKPSMNAGPAGESAEVAKLRAEVKRLREENDQLRLSPANLAFEVDGAIRSGNEEKAVVAYKQLADTFPVASETAEMKRRLDAFMTQRHAQEEGDKRMAALGFKGLPVNASIAQGDTALTLTSVAVNKRWTFDSWGDGWRFLDADKDRRLLIARVNVASKQKEPALFGIAAYTPDGAKLTRLGELKYRFARWSSYGSFLGTTADYRNEFTHSWRIPFTAGVQLSEDDLKRRPIYLVATNEGCHARHFQPYGQPPVFYQAGDCKSLKDTLTIDDFKGGALAVLKRIE
ncbi:MAG TPA: hypothetical protein VMZ74_07795 [Ramlibacter sp.]|nr:hypothetical protein [Ramlibacter sp.]